MDLTKEAIQEIKGGAAAQKLEVLGKSFIAKGSTLTEVEPFNVDTLELNTLEGLVDYIKNGIDLARHNNNVTIVIDNERKVIVKSELRETDLTRQTYAIANAIIPRRNCGYGINTEEFIVEMLSNYLQTEQRDELIKIVSNITEEQSVNNSDNGLSQNVVVKKGVKKIATTIENPIMLRPISTFTEIEQPERPFIFRVKGANNIALYQGNDTLYLCKAKKEIKEYLQKQLQGDKYKNIKIIM